jgi:multidrug efflux pump subunit AcrA (membrane-fusion protein)
VKVPKNIAQRISETQESDIYINGKRYSETPNFVADEATDGLLYGVIYSLPETLVGKVTDNDYIKVDIPVGYPDTLSTIPYLPIDVVFETQEGAYVYLAKNGKVVSRKVELGNVAGGDVEIDKGLTSSDKVILDRNVIEGESVSVTN